MRSSDSTLTITTLIGRPPWIRYVIMLFWEIDFVHFDQLRAAIIYVITYIIRVHRVPVRSFHLPFFLQTSTASESYTSAFGEGGAHFTYISLAGIGKSLPSVESRCYRSDQSRSKTTSQHFVPQAISNNSPALNPSLDCLIHNWPCRSLVQWVSCGACMLESWAGYPLSSYCSMSRMSMEWRKQRLPNPNHEKERVWPSGGAVDRNSY